MESVISRVVTVKRQTKFLDVSRAIYVQLQHKLNRIEVRRIRMFLFLMTQLWPCHIRSSKNNIVGVRSRSRGTYLREICMSHDCDKFSCMLLLATPTIACITGALWAKRGECGILHEEQDEGKRKKMRLLPVHCPGSFHVHQMNVAFQ